MTIPGLARRQDPDTSHAAAESIDATKLIDRIYNAMAEYGDKGCIAQDVENDLPDVISHSITPRFRYMLEKGMIEYTGETRMAATGRFQKVRRILPKPFKDRVVLGDQRPMREQLESMKKYTRFVTGHYKKEKARREKAEAKITELEAKLDKVRGLPEKWREISYKTTEEYTNLHGCADELQAALGDEDGNNT